MAVEGREQVTRIGIVRVNGQPEELAGPDGRRQPSVGGTSRMNREVHVRICERLGVKSPGPTRRFTFLGFEYRRILSYTGKWRPNVVPKLKKRTALFGKLKEIFRRHVSQPVGTLIEEINPILRGWVNYFRVGNSSRCFSVIKDWVEKKVRRHLMRARGRKGYGWKRWSKKWLYDQLGLFNDYRLRRWSGLKVALAR